MERLALLTSRQAWLSCLGRINRTESVPVMMNFSMKFDGGTCTREEHEMAVLVEVIVRLLI